MLVGADHAIDCGRALPPHPTALPQGEGAMLPRGVPSTTAETAADLVSGSPPPQGPPRERPQVWTFSGVVKDKNCWNFPSESQRDSVSKPRIARDELPWVIGRMARNPNGVVPLVANMQIVPIDLMIAQQSPQLGL